jgi:hypothetical protein
MARIKARYVQMVVMVQIKATKERLPVRNVPHRDGGDMMYDRERRGLEGRQTKNRRRP